jgi:hypothetical protein
VFDVGDIIWLHLSKYKLMSQDFDHFKILEKTNGNAYKLVLRVEFGTVSPIINIADLKPYLGEKDEIVSRTTSV